MDPNITAYIDTKFAELKSRLENIEARLSALGASTALGAQGASTALDAHETELFVKQQRERMKERQDEYEAKMAALQRTPPGSGAGAGGGKKKKTKHRRIRRSGRKARRRSRSK